MKATRTLRVIWQPKIDFDGCYQALSRWKGGQYVDGFGARIDDSVKTQLAAQAKRHNRSTEAEVGEIPTRFAIRPNIGWALIQATQSVGGVENLPAAEARKGSRIRVGSARVVYDGRDEGS